MIIETADERGFYLVVLHGEVGYEHAAELEDIIQSGLASDPRDILLDLTDVRYIDSAGLNVILAARAQAAGGIGLIGLNPTLRRLFNIAGLTHCDGFRFFVTVEDAIGTLLREQLDGTPGLQRTSQLPCLPPAPSRCMLPGCAAAPPVPSQAK